MAEPNNENKRNTIKGNIMKNNLIIISATFAMLLSLCSNPAKHDNNSTGFQFINATDSRLTIQIHSIDTITLNPSTNMFFRIALPDTYNLSGLVLMGVHQLTWDNSRAIEDGSIDTLKFIVKELDTNEIYVPYNNYYLTIE